MIKLNHKNGHLFQKKEKRREKKGVKRYDKNKTNSNTHVKCKSSKHSNLKAEIVRLNKKARLNYI